MAQLLGGGTDVNVRNYVGETALMYAASAGHAEVVTQLLAARASVDVQAEDHMQFKDGSTALIKAVQGLEYRHRVGCAEVVTLLLAGKASVDVKNGEGDTALLKAVALGHVDAVTQLLDGGACVDVRDRRGCSVLHVAAAHAVMQYPASIVCYTGVVTGLLGAGASVDVTDRHGRTALMALVTKSYDGQDDAYLADVVMRLLAAGASVDVMDKRGITMLYQSACKGHTTLMTRLLGGGASVDTRTKGGGTALFAAASQGRAAAVALLLSGRASVNAVDDCGCTALIQAAWRGHASVVALLLKGGASTEPQAEPGYAARIAADQVWFVKGDEATDAAPVAFNEVTLASKQEWYAYRYGTFEHRDRYRDPARPFDTYGPRMHLSYEAGVCPSLAVVDPEVVRLLQGCAGHRHLLLEQLPIPELLSYRSAILAAGAVVVAFFRSPTDAFEVEQELDRWCLTDRTALIRCVRVLQTRLNLRALLSDDSADECEQPPSKRHRVMMLPTH